MNETSFEKAIVRAGVKGSEAIKIKEYMDKNYPKVFYTMTPGNDCVWVYFGSQNWYFIFRNDEIADIQID